MLVEFQHPPHLVRLLRIVGKVNIQINGLALLLTDIDILIEQIHGHSVGRFELGKIGDVGRKWADIAIVAPPPLDVDLDQFNQAEGRDACAVAGKKRGNLWLRRDRTRIPRFEERLESTRNVVPDDLGVDRG